MTVQSNAQECERALDTGQLQILGRNGWYDLRRNGATKSWKRNPHRFEIPVKLGFREAFRLAFDSASGGCHHTLRIRPADFNPRNRGK